MLSYLFGEVFWVGGFKKKSVMIKQKLIEIVFSIGLKVREFFYFLFSRGANLIRTVFWEIRAFFSFELLSTGAYQFRVYLLLLLFYFLFCYFFSLGVWGDPVLCVSRVPGASQYSVPPFLRVGPVPELSQSLIPPSMHEEPVPELSEGLIPPYSEPPQASTLSSREIARGYVTPRNMTLIGSECPVLKQPSHFVAGNVRVPRHRVISEEPEAAVNECICC